MKDKFWSLVGLYVLMPLYIAFTWIMFLWDKFQTLIILGLGVLILIFMASFLSYAHKDERKACLEAGYDWSATKYACVINLKKK